jgi:hypothetical protein
MNLLHKQKLYMEEIEDLINKKTSSPPQSVVEFFKDVELDANR